MRLILVATLVVALLGATAQAMDAGKPVLRLPFDLESRGKVVYVADGTRHQILRVDLKTRRTTVVAGTGRPGSGGDGGPAVKATIDEVVHLAIDSAGNLYAADFNAGRVRRISTDGRISTVARVRSATAVAVDPRGGRLAIASIDGPVHLLDLRTRKLTRLATVDAPHGLAYERDGDLLVAGPSGLQRFDAADGTSTVVLEANLFKVYVAPNGALYVLSGTPSGGAIDRVEGDEVVRIAGTGGTTPYRATQPALAAGILPSDFEVLADGTVLVLQSRPVPALRRLVGGRRVTVIR
jgi:outer membrane protein assembly factor BamB